VLGRVRRYGGEAAGTAEDGSSSGTEPMGAAEGVSIPLGGEETVFLSHLDIKMIFLPRQARDKHRENSKKDRLLAGGEEAQLSAAQLRLLEEVGCVRNTHLFCDAIVCSN
jgi:hypothetical protein